MTAHSLAWVVALASAARLQAQPAPGSIVTRNVPFASPVADAAGNLYFTGSAAPGDIAPTDGAAQTQPGGGLCFNNAFPVVFTRTCRDAFVEKTDSAGAVLFAAYLGGTTDDSGSQIVLDGAGNIYVAGVTGGDFPGVPGSGSGAFLAKLSGDGKRILYSMVLPGYFISSLAVDAKGNAYVGGGTPQNHAFATKINPDGSAILYNTVLGGSSAVLSLVVDAQGVATVAGVTSSPDFPVTAAAFQQSLAGRQSAFAARLDADGKIIASTYLGGSGQDVANVVRVDSAGNVYVAGGVTSLDFPTTAEAFQPAPRVPVWSSVPGGFLVKLTPDLHTLAYGTYIPVQGLRDGVNGVTSLAVSASGDAYFAGVAGAGFPVTENAPQPCLAGLRDIVAGHLNAAGSLVEATFAGASGVDLPYRLTVADAGAIELAALFSDASSAQPTLSQIRFGAPGWRAPACLAPDLLHAATLTAGAVSPGQIVSLSGFGIGPQKGVAYTPGPQGEAPESLDGVQVFFDGRAAPVLYAQSRQIDVVTPTALDGAISTTVLVQYNGVPFGPITAGVAPAAPEVYRLNPGVSTQAAAVNEDGTVNGPSNPAPRGSVVALYGTGLGLSDPACTDGARNSGGSPLRATEFVRAVAPVAMDVLFAGSAAQLICGAQQINVRIPGSIAGPLNAVPIELGVQFDRGALTGPTFFQNTSGTTIAVK
jgi:uncharacterized protein (TIGR03437 family)